MTIWYEFVTVSMLVLVQSMLTSALCWDLKRLWLCRWNGLVLLSGFWCVCVREIALWAVIVDVWGVVSCAFIMWSFSFSSHVQLLVHLEVWNACCHHRLYEHRDFWVNIYICLHYHTLIPIMIMCNASFLCQLFFFFSVLTEIETLIEAKILDNQNISDV